MQSAGYDRARRAVLTVLHARGAAEPVITDHLNHLVALVLARVGLLDYDAALGARRRASWHGRVLLEPVVDQAVRALGTELAARRK